MNWLKIHKGCRPKAGEEADCPQAIGVQMKGGTIMGEAAPLRGVLHGWFQLDPRLVRLRPGRGSQAFSELTIEYRFPIISILSGEVFMDAGTDFGTQKPMCPASPVCCWTRTVPVCRWVPV